MTTRHALSTKTGPGTPLRLSWGLVQIPVRLHLVVDTDRSVPARSQFTADGHPVGNQPYDKDTGLPVDRSEIVKRALVGDTWVDLTDAEIEALSTATKGVAEITTFVPRDEFDAAYLIEKPAAWRPDTMKVGKTRVPDPAAAKAVALLSAAMVARDLVAIAYVPSRSGGQNVALFPDGSAGYVAFAENVRPIPPAAEAAVTEQELALANQLIDQIGVDAPVLHDTVGARIAEFLAEKASDPTRTVEVTETPTPEVDLVAALTASLAAAEPAKPARKPRARKADAKPARKPRAKKEAAA